MEDDLIGQVVASRYRVTEKLGEGGMGTVYRAEHVAIGKQLAIKVLLPEYARKADLKERFLREARAAAAIGHENIVDITDFGETPSGSVFFAMEFLDGQDLAHHVKKDGALSWPRAKAILLQICRALGAAHAKQIVHRDMKPENVILISREGRPDFVKVLDFGIAKVSGASDGEQRLTRTGMIFGTPEYMSPEQAQGHHPDHRVDVYAVGVIMYELLSGQVPFKADTFMGILTKHIFEEPVPPSRVNPEAHISPEVEAVVLKAMVKDRNHRYQSMAEMAAAIAQTPTRMTRTSGELQPPAASIVLAPTPIPSLASRTGSDDAPASGTARTQMGGVGARDQAVEELPLELPRRPRGAIYAGLGLALALLGLVLVWSRGAAPPPQPAKVALPAAIPEVTVSVESEPSGARVLKGTIPVGQTPLELRLPQSQRGVMLTLVLAGYETAHEPVTPDATGKRLRVTLHRQPAAASATPDPEPTARSTARALRQRTAPLRRAARRAPRAARSRPAKVDDLINPFE
ncbi:MAG: protein kinase [Proteobacteria bacterium]|nr:protein kinase [Pseudomonadota bacterium]